MRWRGDRVDAVSLVGSSIEPDSILFACFKPQAFDTTSTGP
jgi:hypothetical protein